MLASTASESSGLSLPRQLSSSDALHSLRRASVPSGPYTLLLSLPAEWVARILSYLSPDEKLTEVCHASSALHRSVLSLSSSFRDDFISFAASPLPPLLALSPWFRGVSGVRVRGSGPDPFQLDHCGPSLERVADQEAVDTAWPTERDSAQSGADSSPPHAARPAAPSSTIPCDSTTASALSSPFSSIRSLSISLSVDCAPTARPPPRGMLSSLSGWCNLRHLHIVADDGDWLSAANLNSGLLTAQSFTPFLLLSQLKSLTLDATVKAEQVLMLAGMQTLQCLLLTEREQRAGVDEERRQQEEQSMMAALGAVSRLVRRGKGLTQLRMPRFHFSPSADEFCEKLSQSRLDASPSPMSSLCLQGALSRQGVLALSGLAELSSLTLGWGCELDADERTLAELPQCRSLQHLHVRLVDAQEQDERDEETNLQQLSALSHVLSIGSLTSLSLHLPVSGWTVQHSRALATLTQLRRLTLAGETSAITARHALSYEKLLPLTTPDRDGRRPLPHLRSLTFDWLPLIDDAMLVIAQLSELTSLSITNSPYLSSFLFCVLGALPALVMLKVLRCDINLTERGWRDAKELLDYFRRSGLLPPACLASVDQPARFPSLQILECHLVRRQSCDVDAAGFARLLSLLSPQQLHTFDFDSDYLNSELLLQLSAFPHLRSLGSLSVDISPLDTEVILAAKRSMSRVLACYYDRQYTRIERGERSRWRSRRRSSTASAAAPVVDDKLLPEWSLRSREAEVADDDDQRVMQEEGEDDELDADDSDVAQWKNREERWCSQPRGVLFRHQQAREAFFEQLASIVAEERQRPSSRPHPLGAVFEQSTAHSTAVVPAPETDSDEELSGSAAEGDADSSPRDGQAEEDDGKDSGAHNDGDECELQEQEVVGEEAHEDDADDEWGEWEWSQHTPSSSSPTSLSVSLVGRSSKLHSRRYKRNEKMAIQLKAGLPHAVDKSVRRASSGSGGVRLAGVAGRRKWVYAALR